MSLPALPAAFRHPFARLLGRLFRRSTAGDADAGRWGEEVAAKWLSRQGYAIIGKRVRPNRRDELDLVVQRGEHLVFVEVKTRRNEQYGRPVAAVNARAEKQSKEGR